MIPRLIKQMRLLIMKTIWILVIIRWWPGALARRRITRTDQMRRRVQEVGLWMCQNNRMRRLQMMITHWTSQEIITKVLTGKVQLVTDQCMLTTPAIKTVELVVNHQLDLNLEEVEGNMTWTILELTCLWTIVTSRISTQWKNKIKITKLNSIDFKLVKKTKPNNP